MKNDTRDKTKKNIQTSYTCFYRANVKFQFCFFEFFSSQSINPLIILEKKNGTIKNFKCFTEDKLNILTENSLYNQKVFSAPLPSSHPKKKTFTL